MAQELSQEQLLAQQQRLALSVTQQQLLTAQLTELPLAQLTERITAEMDDNPALETADDDYVPEQYGDEPADSSEAGMTDYEREERQSAIDDALAGIGRDDEELPIYAGDGTPVSDDREEMVYGQQESFYDMLKEQMGTADIDDNEREIMEYLIGSLDDDGLLRKSLESISDELAVYHNIEASATTIGRVLKVLQTFDPPGIGARSLQECLLLQIRRREPSEMTALMERVVEKHFELFARKHWEKLQKQLGLSAPQMQQLLQELRRLNPRPGASLGETMGRSTQHITPDFIVDTHDDGTVTFTLNNGELPELHVSRSFAETVREYQTDRSHMNAQMKEALLYTKRKVDAAQNFIEAIKARQHTLTVTMRAIINWQHRFFEDGDEASLRPMILKDIADKTGLDVSTVSRVSKSKYAQTRWGTFPLRHFFSDSFMTGSGEALSTRQVKSALRELVDAEDKSQPLSDDTLTKLMAERGFPIARRTVAKYREQMGIPVARMRK